MFTKVYPRQTEAQGTLKKLGQVVLEVTPLAQDAFAAALLRRPLVFDICCILVKLQSLVYWKTLDVSSLL